MKNEKVISLTILEIEALLSGAAEWLYRNQDEKDPEAVEIRKALIRVARKLKKLARNFKE